MTDADPEIIKQLIVSYDPKFYLIPARDPENTYKVLWYSSKSRQRCKVDILVPGGLTGLHIPFVPLTHIMHCKPHDDIPLMPFLALLLLKLQGWDDHRKSSEPRFYEKQSADVADIDELLDLAVDKFETRLESEEWLPDWFVQRGCVRISEFIAEFPDTASYWAEIGFHVQ